MIFKYLIVAVFIISFNSSAFSTIEIRCNLQGYLGTSTKNALILSDTPLNSPKLLLKNWNGKIIKEYQGIISNNSWSPFANTYLVDFSEFQKEGQYYFQLEGFPIYSKYFKIGSYPDWQEDIIGFIRSQRCGFNPFINAFCHQKDGLSFFGLIPDSSKIDATGGWHDAGDQLKYLITGSNTTARLLMSYEKFPNSFKDNFDDLGKQSSNGLPDVLDEAKWGLDWLLKLHPRENELYHQVADDRDHRGFKLPQEDNADYGWGKNSFRPAYFATGKPQGLSKYKSKATGIANLAGRSSATLSMGYTIFKEFPAYKQFAQKCLKASIELYNMGKEKEGYQQGNSFGAPYRYEENTWADDMEWAAANLFKITKEDKYLEDARVYAEKIGAWSWMERDTASHYEMYPFVNMGHYALWQIGDEKDKLKALDYYDLNLQKIKERASKNPYNVGHLFIWCSNNLAAAVSTQAMLYKEMSGSGKYDDLMQSHLNWLLGLNPWNSSMITGIPENADSPEDVHMPFWLISKKMVKGSLVDGPIWNTIHQNMLGIKPSKPDEYSYLQPKKIKYLDDWADYSTNEPTLDGSAELLILFTYLNAQ